ncbi:MAG TPA: zf-HC2 domain-containing protein [Blastocatellia bacterium]|jgi:anti-sigma factor RsiW|nr:zf-HC2 domain-containing protein [Blastocatellia bacterium]
MNCKRVEESMALYVGRDLDSTAEDAVSAHLRSCAACTRLAAEYSDSQEWLASYAPRIDSELLEGVRRGVLGRIPSELTKPTFLELITSRFRWEVAFAAAVLIVVLTTLALQANREHRNEAPQQRIADAPENSPRSSPAVVRSEREEQMEPRVPDRKRPRRSGLREVVARAVEPIEPEWLIDAPPTLESEQPLQNDLPEATEAEQQNAVTYDYETRIEIQTSDPNIRIIWFTPKNERESTTR